MKARWDSREYFEMSKGKFRFAADDIDLIYRGLDARIARQEGAALIAAR